MSRLKVLPWALCYHPSLSASNGALWEDCSQLVKSQAQVLVQVWGWYFSNLATPALQKWCFLSTNWFEATALRADSWPCPFVHTHRLALDSPFPLIWNSRSAPQLNCINDRLHHACISVSLYIQYTIITWSCIVMLMHYLSAPFAFGNSCFLPVLWQSSV